MRGRLTKAGAAVAVLCATFAFIAANALGAVETPPRLWQFPPNGENGSGARELGTATALAADPATGKVYVLDGRNNRIDVLSSWGKFLMAFGWGVADGTSEELQTCTDTCFAGIPGTGPGQLMEPGGIAVGAGGTVYVFEYFSERTVGEVENSRLQAFDPESGTDGTEASFLFAIGGEVNKTKSAEPASTEAERNLCTAASGDVCGAGAAGTGHGAFQYGTHGSPNAVAAGGPDGTVYVADNARIQEAGNSVDNPRIQAFAPDGSFVSQFALPLTGDTELARDDPSQLAVAPTTGDLYLTYKQGSSARSLQPNVYKFSPAGTLLAKVPFDTPESITVDAAGNLYVFGYAEGHTAQTPPHELLEFDPAGNAVIPVGTGFAAADVFTDRRALATGVRSPGSNEPGDLYVGTLTGSFEAFVTAYGPAPEFELPPKAPPEILDQYATSVNPEGAILKAVINPHFWKDTTYYLEYGTGKCSEGGCGSQQPAPPGKTLTKRLEDGAVLGSGISLEELAPHTTYHYRVVAQSSGSDGVPVRGIGGKPGNDGAEGTFTTPALPLGPPNPDPCPNAATRTGPSALLPDCRAYEMVSPVDKDNSNIYTTTTLFSYPARLDQAAASGEAFTFSAVKAFAGSASGIFSNQYLSHRGPGGWSTEAISPALNGSDFLSSSLNAELDTPFRAFSAQLDTAWLIPQFGPTPDPSAPGGFVNLFRRDTSARSYEAQIRTVPPHFEARTDAQYPELEGVSDDGRHAVIRTADNLTPDAPELDQRTTQVYEAYREGSGPAQLRLVSILPNGEPAESGSSAGVANIAENGSFGRLDGVTHAISEDGSRIYWTASDAGPGQIYVRVGGEVTLPVSEAVKPIDSSPARFLAASADGSEALFTFISGPNAGRLYLFLLEAGKAFPIAGKVNGLAGQSEDLSRFYFGSEEELAEGASAGKPNLYLYEEGSLRFIAQLSAADTEPPTSSINFSLTRYSPLSVVPFYHAASATPNGDVLTFMSVSRQLAESVAGYDNTDQKTGEADAEAYRYDALTGKLACISCNPSGARPLGREIIFGTKETHTPGAGVLPNADSELHQPRYLSTDGSRVFFESFEALLPNDTNGKMDVYQWEARGSGDCAEAKPTFVMQSEGCLSLISSGESPQDSEFIDASANGSDVFFLTLSSLVAQDPNLVDVYDARVGGGYPPPPPPPPPCEGEACQGPQPDRNFPTPSSAGYAGPGNAKPVTRKRCPAGKRQVRRKGRAHCMRRHRTIHRKRAQRHANANRRHNR